MGYLFLQFCLLLILSLTVAVNSQTVRCFSQSSCGGSAQDLADGVDSSACCNWPGPGVRPRGFSYQFTGDGQCRPCPKMFGFFNRTFSIQETTTTIPLSMGYLSGEPVTSFGGVTVTVAGITAIQDSDFTVTGVQRGSGQFALNPGQEFLPVTIQHTNDGVAQEREEQYTLTPSNFFNLQDFEFVGTTGTIIDSDRATFFFSETDHSVDEGRNPIIVAPLSKNTDIRLANPITFQVLPVTIAEARRRGWPIPTGAMLEDDPASPYEATAADFNTTTFRVTFPADDQSASVVNSINTIRVGVTDDDINERFEQLFLIEVEVVEAVNPSTVDITQNVTVGIIVDNDLMVIGFKEPLYTFDEPDRTLVEMVPLGKLNNQSTEQTFEINVDVATGTEQAAQGEDFSFTATVVTLRPDQDCAEVNITLLPDSIPERNEVFNLTSSPSGELRYTLPSPGSSVFQDTSITIRDNDAIIIGFEEQLYSVNEGESIMICLNVTNPPVTLPLSLSDVVFIRTQPGSGTAGSSDYSPQFLLYQVASSEANVQSARRICSSFTATDDGTLEDNEYIELSLVFVLPTSDNVVLQPFQTRVNIVDKDDVVIGFSPDIYSVSEGGIVNFNVSVLSGSLIRDSVVEFFTSDSSAAAPSDYIATSRTLTFNSDNLHHVVPVMVNTDSILEDNEVFFGNLTLSPGEASSSVRLVPSDAAVTITDSNDAVIGFSGNYTVSEGGIVNLELLVFSGSLARDVVLSVSTADGTAQAVNDYSGLVSQLVTFSPGQRRVLIPVQTSLDDIVEFDEHFTARASLVSADAAVTVNPELAFVNIEDDDEVVIGFSPSIYSVRETDGSITLTASVLSGMLARPVRVSFFTTDGSATSTSPEDFKAVSNLVLEFSAETLSQQINIDIVNDKILENSEVFYGNLSTSDDAVRLSPAGATVNINESPGDDVVQIGFRPLNYTVNEEDGSVTFTILVINGTLEREVTISFFTSSGTATEEDPKDYEGLSTILTFSPNEAVQIVTVTLVDDSIVEGSEYFEGNIVGTPDLVIASPTPATVTVNENTETDRITVGFDPASYTVNEVDGSVTLTAQILSGVLERSAVVDFFTTDGSATSADPQDYMDTSSSLTFDPSTRAQQIEVVIINDDAVEHSESFNGNLSTSDVAVDLAPSAAQVTIQEVPGEDEIIIGFTETSFTTMEDGGPVEVCVMLLSAQGLLERDAVVTLQTLDGTAVYPEDYSSISEKITFSSSSDSMVCVNIPVTNDIISEGKQQFAAILTSSDSSVILQPERATIEIDDEDDITIGFDRTRDSVSEDAGSITVFVEVKDNGMLQRSVVVNYSTPLSSENTATSGVDYEATSGQLTFDSSTSRLSFPITIRNDEIAEGPEELLLQLTTEEQRVNLDPAQMDVEIVDNDGVTIGFLRNSYTGSESDGYVTLSVGVTSGQLQRDFVVTVTNEQENVRNAATAPADYQSFSVDLTFSGSTNRIDFNVSLQDDSITENREEFLASLRAVSSDTVAQVSPRIAEVFIEDNDRVTIGFAPDSYTVDEVDGTVSLTVMILDGVLDRSAAVNFFTTDGTATSSAPEDYRSVSQTAIIFDGTTTSQEVRVTIINDGIVENSEFFFGNLTTTDGAVILNPSNARVEIMETERDDSVHIGFVPDSYTVNENDGTITFTVSILEGTLERDAVVFFSTADGSATSTESADFIALTNVPLTFSPSKTSNTVTVSVVDDDIVENSEFFFGNLSTSDSSVNLDPSGATVTIMEVARDDNVLIGFDPDSYIVNEKEGTVTYTVMVLEGALERDAVVFFSTTDGSATSSGSADFNARVNVPLTFSASRTSNEVTVDIIDDNIVENSEFFFGNLTTTDSSVNLNPSGATVTITEVQGDDSVRIGFDPDSYTVSEKTGTATLTLRLLEGTLERNAMVFFSTNDGSATSTEPEDFTAVFNEPVTFSPSTRSQEVTVSITDDNIVENSEFFYGNISTADSAVNLDPAGARVTISEVEGDDSIHVGFRPDSFMVSEADGTVSFTAIILEGSLERDAVVFFSTTDGSATSTDPADFEAITNRPLTFSPSANSKVVTVTLVNDAIVENPEFFFGNLTTTDAAINLNPSDARVTISEEEGEDSIRIGFEPDSYAVNEKDGRVILTVKILEGTLERDAVVSFSTTEGTATSTAPADFISVLDEKLTFGPSTTSNQVTITVVTDSSEENPEYFLGNLSTADSAVNLNPSAARVTIADSGDTSVRIGFDPDSYTVNEEDGTVTFTVTILEGTLEREAVVFFSTTDGSATSTGPADFNAVSNMPLTFGPSRRSIMVSVDLINDDIVESSEFFFGNLTSDGSISLGPSAARVTISEMEGDDRVQIGFDPDSSTVNEKDGTITLTVKVLQGTLERDAVVSLFTTDGSATSIDSPDFTAISNRKLTFSPSESSNEVTITIVDDDILENTEFFFGNLTTTDGSVNLNPSSTRVTILETEGDDSIQVGFDPDSYTVNEEDGTVTFVVKILEGALERDAVVFFSTTDGTATSTTPADFEAVTNRPLTFSPSTSSNEVTVTIINDEVVENSEFFFGNLSSSDDGIRLNPSGTKVTISEVEGDDKIRIGFDPSSYTVNEEDGSVTITVTILEGSLERDAVVFFSTTDGSATSTDPADFSAIINRPLTFSSSTTSGSVTIVIIGDSREESSEVFYGNLTSTDSAVDVLPSSVPITIRASQAPNNASGIKVNDTVIGDPLYTVPIRVPQEQLDALNLKKLSLCYEIHGKSEQWFNLVTDSCTTVNTRYAMLSPRLNIMDAIAVRAVDTASQCVNIRVDVAECSAMVGSSSLDVLSKYESNGIMVKRYSNRVRISVPNCQDLTLVMWVICENRSLENPDSMNSMLTSKMIKFVVMRGLNFGHKQAHGLLGQFWNIPVNVAPYNGLLSNGEPSVGRYIVNITVSGVTRSYTGILHDRTWDLSEGPCLFVGNRQSGPISEVKDPNAPVIESLYTSYEVKDVFTEDSNYKFGMFDESRCIARPTI